MDEEYCIYQFIALLKFSNYNKVRSQNAITIDKPNYFRYLYLRTYFEFWLSFLIICTTSSSSKT